MPHTGLIMSNYIYVNGLAGTKCYIDKPLGIYIHGDTWTDEWAYSFPN